MNLHLHSREFTYLHFLYLGINSLKSYLNVRGLATSGYSRVELLAKAFLASEMNFPIMSSAEQKQSLIKDYNKQPSGAWTNRSIKSTSF